MQTRITSIHFSSRIVNQTQRCMYHLIRKNCIINSWKLTNSVTTHFCIRNVSILNPKIDSHYFSIYFVAFIFEIHVLRVSSIFPRVWDRNFSLSLSLFQICSTFETHAMIKFHCIYCCNWPRSLSCLSFYGSFCSLLNIHVSNLSKYV